MIERQELYCHACGRYVQFNLDLSVDGNYKLDCPNCGHDHYRVVKDGKITDERYDQSRSQQSWMTVSGYVTSSATSSYDTSTASSVYLYRSWMNTATAM